MPRQATASSQEQDVTELTKYKKRRQILLELPSSQLVPPRKFRRWDLERIKAPEKEVVGMLRGEVGGERSESILCFDGGPDELIGGWVERMFDHA